MITLFLSDLCFTDILTTDPGFNFEINKLRNRTTFKRTAP